MSFNLYSALRVAQQVFEQYQRDQPKMWARMDGTPILNDVAVRMAEAFVKADADAMAATLAKQTPDNGKVICPNCTLQFHAVPVNVQKRLKEAIEGETLSDRIALRWQTAAATMTTALQWIVDNDKTECTPETQHVMLRVVAAKALEDTKSPYPTKPLRLALGGCPVEDIAGADNLAIALCTYFENHQNRPDDDDENEDGWGKWAVDMTNNALSALVRAVCSAQLPEPTDRIRALLESYFWPSSLRANMLYMRIHDDHDGTYRGHIGVMIGDDGDAWVNPVNAEGNGLRFRMPIHGGGASEYTRTALVILAEAIRLDNERAPIVKPPA